MLYTGGGGGPYNVIYRGVGVLTMLYKGGGPYNAI